MRPLRYRTVTAWLGEMARRWRHAVDLPTPEAQRAHDAFVERLAHPPFHVWAYSGHGPYCTFCECYRADLEAVKRPPLTVTVTVLPARVAVTRDTESVAS